jgi:hypothetical protein
MTTMSKDGKGLLLLPDVSGSSLSKELDSLVTKDMTIKQIIDNVKILLAPKIPREEFLRAVDIIIALVVGLLTDDELRQRAEFEEEATRVLVEMENLNQCKQNQNLNDEITI